MGAFVAFLGAEQAQAGLVAAFVIGKLGGEVFPGVLPVGHQVTQYQAFALQVEDPQSARCRRLRVVNHGQMACLTGAIVHGALHGADGTF